MMDLHIFHHFITKCKCIIEEQENKGKDDQVLLISDLELPLDSIWGAIGRVSEQRQRRG